MRWLSALYTLAFTCFVINPLGNEKMPQRLFLDNGEALDPHSFIAEKLTALEPFLSLVEKALEMPLTTHIVDELLLDVEFKKDEESSAIFIRKNLFTAFEPEQLEVVIASRIARSLAESSWRTFLALTFYSLEMGGMLSSVVCAVFLAHSWFKERTIHLSPAIFYLALSLAVWGSGEMIKTLAESERAHTEYALTKNLIVSPEAQAFLASLSSTRRWESQPLRKQTVSI